MCVYMFTRITYILEKHLPNLTCLLVLSSLLYYYARRSLVDAPVNSVKKPFVFLV